MRRFALPIIVCALSFGAASCCCSGRIGGHSRRATTVQSVSSTAVTYVKAGLAGDEDTVRKLCVPGRAVAGQAVTDLPQMLELDTFDVIEVRADADAALVLSNKLPGEHGEGASQLVFLLLRQPTGAWLIDDIDFEDAEGLRQDLARFSLQHPAATVLLETVKSEQTLKAEAASDKVIAGFSFEERPLPEVIYFFRVLPQCEGVNFVLDPAINPEEVFITLTMKNVTLRSALNAMLRPIGLDHAVWNEAVFISTEARIRGVTTGENPPVGR